MPGDSSFSKMFNNVYSRLTDRVSIQEINLGDEISSYPVSPLISTVSGVAAISFGVSKIAVGIALLPVLGPFVEVIPEIVLHSPLAPIDLIKSGSKLTNNGIKELGYHGLFSLVKTIPQACYHKFYLGQNLSEVTTIRESEDQNRVAPQPDHLQVLQQEQIQDDELTLTTVSSGPRNDNQETGSANIRISFGRRLDGVITENHQERS